MAHSGEVLNLLEEKITMALKAKRLRASERTLLEIQQLFVIYMQDDHPKTQAMWQVFRPAVWVGSAFIISFIGLIASGRVEIIIK